jgi:hypothetical protein
MAQGKKGTAGDPVKFAGAKGVTLVARRMSEPLSRGHGEPLDATGVHRLANLVGLVALSKCEACMAGKACVEHQKGLLLHALDIPGAEAANAQEHKELVDFYDVEFAKARGVRPKYGAPDWRAFAALRDQLGLDGAKDIIRRALRDRFWKGKVTIQDIAKNPSRFQGAERLAGSQQCEEFDS